jgi:Kef-type K+ transport system membrane component KefB
VETVWLTATIWTGLALAASVVSLWLGLSIALTEIFAGSVGGNALGLQTTPWLDFLVGFGSVLLTFLAGAEIDPESFRRHLKPSPAIGAVAFLFPFLGALVAGWDLSVVEIAGIPSRPLRSEESTR